MTPTDGALQSLVISYPATVYTAVSTALAFFALTPAPSLVAVALLLAVVRLSSQALAPRPGGATKAALQAGAIALASGAAHLAPSVEALSTPNVALLATSAITFASSAFAVALVFAGTRFGYAGTTHWARLTLFPALWASGWGSMSSVSPLGQLITWSPVHGLGPYEWIRPVFGQWGIDWVVAAWAVVLSEVLGDWLMGQREDEESDADGQHDVDPLLVDHAQSTNYGTIPTPPAIKSRNVLSRSRSMLVLTGMLALLMVPEYFAPTLPLPIAPSVDVTPFAVGCALPGPHKSGGNPTLDDFITETVRLHSAATVIIWPENAVRFESPEEREKAFERIQGLTPGNKYIGVSFEEYVPSEKKGEPGKRYNAFALITREGPPLLEYHKRNLVPVAESLSLTPGHTPPQVLTLNLTKPKDWHGPGWSQHGSTRPIPLTTSICLDLAHSTALTSLPSRPALLLAPARTWHPAVGAAMWAQARARARESGVGVVWCDGGAGGVSGVAGPQHAELVQVGSGSWVRAVPLAYPFEEGRTWYMAMGGSGAAAALWAVALVGFLVEKALGGAPDVGVGFVLRGVRGVVEMVRRRKEARRAARLPEGNLIDVW